MDKYERFKRQKELDKDPLVRYCPKPDCDSHMRAKKIKGTDKL